MAQVILILVLVAGADAGREVHQEEPLCGAPAKVDLEVVMRGIESADQHLRRSAEWALRWQRSFIALRLRGVMARGGKGELPEVNAEAAISLLGELRDKDAATGLVEMLKFTMNPTGPSGRKLYHTTPQIPALISIGLPSLDPLIRKVASTDDEVIRERAGIVIDQILGTDMAVFFVRDRRDRETDDTKRQRLNRLLDQIDKVERNRKGKIHIGPLKPPPVISPQPK